MDVFALAEQAELTVAEIYTIFCKRFHDDADLRALFGLIAEEERGHARYIRQTAASWRADGDWEPSGDLLRLAELSDRAEMLLATVLRQEDMSAQQAIDLAAKLEQDFHEVHAQILAGDEAPELRDLFVRLTADDHGHTELFERLRRGTLKSSPAARSRRETMELPAASRLEPR